MPSTPSAISSRPASMKLSSIFFACAAARHLAARFDAAIEVTEGPSLAEGFPAINTVGRAAEVGPRLIDMRWGDAGPKITLIGKGITFDSGGLDLKPSKAMELMKKDMGGAAAVLGLASAIMESGLQLQLRVLVPAAENAVSERATFLCLQI